MLRITTCSLFSALMLTLEVSATVISIPGDYATVQAGIDASSDGDTVLLQPQTYYENINFNGRRIVVASWFLTTGDTFYVRQTVIDGHGTGTTVTFDHHEDSLAVIAGVTIQNGFAQNGGGIRCNASSPRIEHLIVVDNSAQQGGGGMDFFGSSPNVTNCVIRSNTAGDFGGGVSNDLASPTFVNCVFSGNTTDGSGGAVSNYTFSGAVFINCVISGNSASTGGGIWNGGSSPHLINCIVWGNTPGEIYGAPAVIAYSDVGGGWPGEGNMDSDPLFRNPEIGDYHLMAVACGDSFNSPCIDAGDPGRMDKLLACDRGLGLIRSDMGAYGGGDANCPVLLTGDVNENGSITAEDIIAMVNFVFKGGAGPLPCDAAGDVNCSGVVNAADIIHLVGYIFKAGPAPCDICDLIPGEWTCS